MKNTKVISAQEARNFVLDMHREAKVLSEEAIENVLEAVDVQVRVAMKIGNLQAMVNITPISRLTDINTEAAKRAIIGLSANLIHLGYKFDSFNTNTTLITLRWD